MKKIDLLFLLMACLCILFFASPILGEIAAQGKDDTLDSTLKIPTPSSSKLRRLMYLPDARKINYSTINATQILAIEKSPYNCYNLLLGFPKFHYPNRDTINIIKNSKKGFWPRIIFPFYLQKEPQYLINLWDKEIIARGLLNIQEALKLAKETKVEGIFIDPEFYGNLNNYYITYLSKTNNKKPEEIIARLKEIGSKIADLTNQIYRGERAVLWFALADLSFKMKDGYGRSINYMIEGILERIKNQNYNIDIIDGGEISIGYVNLSVKDTLFKINRQYNTLKPYIDKYYPHYKLGATTSIFHDIEQAGFWKKYIDALPESRKEIKKLDDYLPLLKLLFLHYEYVWIYWDGGIPAYNDFDKPNAEKYWQVIRAALPEGYKQNY